MFVIYCGSFSQLLNYNIWWHEIQQSLLAPWGTLGPWTHSAYIAHFSTLFVPLSLHRRPYFPLQEPFISQSWILPTIFFLPHSTFSLQISLLSPELTLICFFSHRAPNCPTSGFPRQPTPIWSGPSFWPSLFVSPQIEIREYIDDIILYGPSLQISQTNTFAQPRLQSLIFQGPTLHASSHLLGPKHYPNPQSHHFWEKALNPVSCYPLY